MGSPFEWQGRVARRRGPGVCRRRGAIGPSSPMKAAGLGRARGLLVAALVASLWLGACGGGRSSTQPAPKTAGARSDPALCGLAAFAKASQPVEVTLWHPLWLAQADWLTQAIKRFNASQH